MDVLDAGLRLTAEQGKLGSAGDERRSKRHQPGGA